MTLPRKTTRFGALQVAICLLALATAAVHIYLGAITHVMVDPTRGDDSSRWRDRARIFRRAVLPRWPHVHRADRSPLLSGLRPVPTADPLGSDRTDAATIVAYFALIHGHYDALGIGD